MLEPAWLGMGGEPARSTGQDKPDLQQGGLRKEAKHKALGRHEGTHGILANNAPGPAAAIGGHIQSEDMRELGLVSPCFRNQQCTK